MTGDEVLILFAKIISENIREEDIFSRWGGEEFIAIFDNCNGANAIHHTEKLRKIISETSFPKAQERVTCSIGVTEITETDDSDSVILRVDQALYQAKEQGRNCVICL
jgi:diguanylate cyclase (GGDEF)-like protein